jgi:hypothetical protein
VESAVRSKRAIARPNARVETPGGAAPSWSCAIQPARGFNKSSVSRQVCVYSNSSAYTDSESTPAACWRESAKVTL